MYNHLRKMYERPRGNRFIVPIVISQTPCTLSSTQMFQSNHPSLNVVIVQSLQKLVEQLIFHRSVSWKKMTITTSCFWSLLPEIFAFSLANFRQNGWPDISSWAKCFFRYHFQPAQCQCSYIFSAGDISFNHSCITLGLTLSVEIHEWN